METILKENQVISARPNSRYRKFIKVFISRKIIIFSLIILFLLVFLAIFAPWVAPYDPYEQNLNQVLQKPSSDHLLGTDQFGRDVLSRIIYGTRASLAVGIVSVLIAGTAGLILGLLAGYFRGFMDVLIMRVIDALMSIPPIVLALALGAAMGGGLVNVMISLGVSLIPTYARLMRGQVLSVRQADYVLAAEISGASHLRIMVTHVIPNCISPLIVLSTMNLGFAILAEAGLSFLGLGIAPPGAAWGSMINDGYKYLTVNPVLSFAPGMAIMLVVLSFNLIGDALRDALDPNLRGSV
jgi:ABC-type dipeptide/oligopeptide/nickel transport system permease subunit